MNSKLIYIQGLKEALVEREKAKASVKGLLNRIAEEKCKQLTEIIKEEKPYDSEGFIFVCAEPSILDYGTDAFSVSARFLLKEVKIPKVATKKEINLLNDYKQLIKYADWNWPFAGKDLYPAAGRINDQLKYLKNGFTVLRSCYYRYPFSDILEGDSFFKEGFSFQERYE